MQPEYSSYAQELKAGHAIIAQTVGDSMKPLLRQGETQVVLVPLNGPLKKGDLPLYQRPNGRYVLHRVVDVRQGVYYTRGDNRFGEERVEPEWMLGVTQAVIRHGKTVPVTALSYQCYVALWLGSYPLRHFADRVRRLPEILSRLLGREGAPR